jgi:hypothetical protein
MELIASVRQFDLLFKTVKQNVLRHCAFAQKESKVRPSSSRQLATMVDRLVCTSLGRNLLLGMLSALKTHEHDLILSDLDTIKYVRIMRRFDEAYFRGREELKTIFKEKAMLKEEAAQRLLASLLSYLKGISIERNSLENIDEQKFHQFLIAKGNFLIV